ncbi:hypothetical protein TNCV_2081341 [Trichonephila clavipes]|nr:hypothetical protein TNCV_2081341 [Trichonephila clavipes]
MTEEEAKAMGERQKKQRWLVEEQMRHVQEEHKRRMKKEQKCLPEERCNRMNEQNQLLSEDVDPDAVAQPVAVEEKKGFISNVPLISTEDETFEEKEETPVDARKDKAKGDVNPVILSKERVDFR